MVPATATADSSGSRRYRPAPWRLRWLAAMMIPNGGSTDVVAAAAAAAALPFGVRSLCSPKKECFAAAWLLLLLLLLLLCVRLCARARGSEPANRGSAWNRCSVHHTLTPLQAAPAAGTPEGRTEGERRMKHAFTRKRKGGRIMRKFVEQGWEWWELEREMCGESKQGETTGEERRQW